jgi:hypothetical protein
MGIATPNDPSLKPMHANARLGPGDILLAMAPPFAIVVPVGPGDLAWRDLLPQLQQTRAAEISLVFPAGERPPDAQALCGAAWTTAPAGRARQQNAGADSTRAPWLWFLHADSTLEPGAVAALHRFLIRGEQAVGYFDLRFSGDGPTLAHLNAWGARFRSRVLGLPFGDQGFVMLRSVFEELGGFDERLAGGEDHALIWSARDHHIPVRPVGAPLSTSARKYSRDGWLRTTARHLALTYRQAREFSRNGGMQ